MSFGYLIITSEPCSVLTKTRGETFSLIEERAGRNIYFRFCESGSITERIGEKQAVITENGMDFFRRVYQVNQGRFLFSDTLLLNRESAVDFAKAVLKQMAEKKVLVIQAEKGRKIDLRQAYFIELNQVAIVNQHIFNTRQQAEDSTDSTARCSNAVVKVKLINYKSLSLSRKKP